MRRSVRLVAEQPARKGSKARLFAYGFAAIADLSGVSEKTIARAINRHDLNPQSLFSVLSYVNAKTYAQRTPDQPGPAGSQPARQ